jgi:type II secretory pathway pseudopilin PulG
MIRRARQGVTIMEAMVAIAVIVVMSGIALSLMTNAVRTREVLAERDETTRAARVVMSTLRRELQLAFLREDTTSAQTYSTIFVGEDDSPDVIWFASLGHERLYRDSRECDQTEITVWTEHDPDGPGFILFHREAPRIDHEPDEDGTILPLAYAVRSFELRYLDPTTNEWRDEWDTRGTDTPNRLPRAVQIGLTLLGRDVDDPERTVEMPFFTTVQLEYGEPLKKEI